MRIIGAIFANPICTSPGDFSNNIDRNISSVCPIIVIEHSLILQCIEHPCISINLNQCDFDDDDHGGGCAGGG